MYTYIYELVHHVHHVLIYYFSAAFVSYIPTAIYLAKKNIRKQGELMEYEKVQKVCVRHKLFSVQLEISTERQYYF